MKAHNALILPSFCPPAKGLRVGTGTDTQRIRLNGATCVMNDRSLSQNLIPHLLDLMRHRSRGTFNYDRLADVAASLDSANFASGNFITAQRLA